MISQVVTSFNIDAIIHTLMTLGNKTHMPLRPLHINELIGLCDVARTVLSTDKLLVDARVPIKVCGDTHGQFRDLLRIFRMSGDPLTNSYMFLGDYVDRGPNGIEITRTYGFFEECKRRYSVRLWIKFVSCFKYMPICGVIENRLICMHGGISPEMMSTELQTIDDLKRRIRGLEMHDYVEDTGMASDMLWSDPYSEQLARAPSTVIGSVALNENLREGAQFDEHGFTFNTERGRGKCYRTDTVEKFLKKFKLDFIVRAHQLCTNGFVFYGAQPCLTIFSCPNYMNYFMNAGAVLHLWRNTKRDTIDDRCIKIDGRITVLEPEVGNFEAEK